MKLSEYMRGAWDKIADPAKWIQGSYQVHDRFCSVGALSHHGAVLAARGEISNEEYSALYDRAKNLLDQSAMATTLNPSKAQGIVGYNDSHPHGDVAAVWMNTISELERTGH